MVNYYRNKTSSSSTVAVWLKQDTARTQSGAKQTRISTSAYEKVTVKSISWDENQNTGADKTCGTRQKEPFDGAIDISGNIEIEVDFDL